MKPMLREKKNEVFQSIIYHFLDISTHILDNAFLIHVLIFNMSSEGNLLDRRNTI